MQTVTFLVFFSFIASLWVCADLKPIEDEQPQKPLGPFHDLVKLIPFKKIDQIVQSHLENDAGFRAAVKVLKSESWLQMMEKLKMTPEFQNFSELAQKYNLNITKVSSCIMDNIKSLNLTAVGSFDEAIPADTPEAEPNLESFVTELQQALPLGKFAKLLSDENPEFKKIREDLSSEENRQIAIALHNTPEMVEIRKNLKTMHFDIQPYISLIYSFLGWELPEE